MAASKKKNRERDVSAHQPGGAGGQTGGWAAWVSDAPLWADATKADPPFCGLASLKGIPSMWDSVIKADTPSVG